MMTPRLKKQKSADYPSYMVIALFSLFDSLVIAHVILDHSLSLVESIFSILAALLCFIFMGLSVFIRPYKKLQEVKRHLSEAKKEAEKIAQFPLNNPHPLLQVCENGKILFMNPAAERIFPDLQAEGFNHPALCGLLENPKKLKTREFDYHGSTFHQTIEQVKTSHAGISFVIYCYDITSIKTVQEKARLLEATVVGANDGMIITTADIENPEIVFVNQAITEISGYSAEELIGQTPRVLQGRDIDKKTLTALKAALVAGEPFKGELKNYSKQGRAYWLDISIVPVRDEKGRVTHFAAIERDITQRKAFEKELLINREAAEVANRAKDSFLSNMSHELRTPMNGIIGLSELLSDMELNEDQKELADAIHSSSRNLLILLNDILDLSKIEARELTLERIPFDLRRAVQQTVDLLRPMASRKGIVLESTINPIVPERIKGDPTRLQQILNNLVGNALKFTEKGYVRIDITSNRDKSGDHLMFVRVEDTGIGIPEDKRETVFRKFSQADVTTARKYGGTGLGLTITKELVEMMGGEISFDSAESKGTTFYAEIPIEIAVKDKETGEEDKTVQHTNINKNARIMVVDDHPVNLLFMRKVLKKIGFENADEAQSGKQAIDLYKQGKYDLIFMDCQMPEMDGFEASMYIREVEDFTNQTKIIAVTADAMKGARERCIDSGMNDYISKPIDVEKLRAVLSTWLPEAKTKAIEEGKETPESETQSETDKAIIDWERLMMFTDGNLDEEKALIEIFTTYAEESIGVLKKECSGGDSEIWKKAAHKLKGSAANLGASLLSDACYEAEQAYNDNFDTKEGILVKVLSAYDQVCQKLNARAAQ